MERVITEEKLKQFLKDMDGASESASEKAFSLWCNLEDHVHKNELDITPNSGINAMVDKILDLYGTKCSLKPGYTYSDLVEMLGTDFEFIDDRGLIETH